MADLLRIVSFPPPHYEAARPTVEMELINGTTFFSEPDTVRIEPGEPQLHQSASDRRYEGSHVVGERQPNARFSWTARILGSADQVLSNAESLIAQISKVTPHRYVEFRPDGAAHSVFCELRGPATRTGARRRKELLHGAGVPIGIVLPVAPLVDWPSMDVADDFGVDSLADYTFDAGSGLVSVSGGQVMPVGDHTAERRFWHSARGYSYGDHQATIKATPGTTLASFKAGRALKRRASNTYLDVYVDDDGAASRLRIDLVQGGVRANRASVNLAARIAAGTAFWVRGRVEGNTVHAEHFTAEATPMGAPANATSYTLAAGAERTDFGEGAVGQIGTVWTPQHANARLDELRDEPYTFRNRSFPDTLQLNGDVPGTAPAKVDAVVTHSGGVNVPEIFDDFSSNTIADYVFDVGSGTLSVSGGELVPSDTADKRFWHNGRGDRYADVAATIKYRIGAATGAAGTTSIGLLLRRLDASNWLFARVDAGAGDLLILKYDGGAFTSLSSTVAAAHAVNTTYWLRFIATGNTLTAERWTTDPALGGSPAQTATHTLSGANATKFGANVVGDVGARLLPAGTDWRLDDLRIVPTVAQRAPVHALLGFCDAHFAAGQKPPFGIIEAESNVEAVGLTSRSDAARRGGTELAVVASAVASPAYASFEVDPSLIPAMDFARGEVAVEVWAAIRMDAGVTDPKAVASLLPAGAGLGAERFTEHGSGGRSLLGAGWGMRRLGVLTLLTAPSRLWRLRVALTWKAATPGARLALDYVVLALAERRAAQATGIANDTFYPKFLTTTAQARKRVRHDLSAVVAAPPEADYPDHGLGGALLEAGPGKVTALYKPSSRVPDDPTATAAGPEQLSHPATVHFAVVPRSFVGRGA